MRREREGSRQAYGADGTCAKLVQSHTYPLFLSPIKEEEKKILFYYYLTREWGEKKKNGNV